MCESQREVLSTYRQEGISVGKMQVSSAIVAEFDRLPASDRRAAFQQLASFAEDRYLHQTTIQHADGPSEFHSDLPQALDRVADGSQATGTWRVTYLST